MSHPRLQLIIAALLLSSGGVAIKATSFSPLQIASFRCLAAAAIFFLVMPGIWRDFNRRTLLVGSAYAVTSISFVLATRLTSAAHAIFLQDISPLFIALFSVFWLKERLQRRDLVFMTVLAAGLGLCLAGAPVSGKTMPNPLAGNLIALFSGFFWALTITGLRWLERSAAQHEQPAAAAIAGGCLIAGLCTLPVALGDGGGRSSDWLIALYLGGAAIVLVFILMGRALRQVNAVEASLILLLEPALNPLWVWLVQGEYPGGLTIVGGGVILAATILHGWLSRESTCSTAGAAPILLSAGDEQ